MLRQPWVMEAVSYRGAIWWLWMRCVTVPGITGTMTPVLCLMAGGTAPLPPLPIKWFPSTKASRGSDTEM